jgi:hypothetical protein
MTEISASPEVHRPKPEFDAGTFTISHLATSPEGFVFQTRNRIGRTEGIASNNLDPDKKIPVDRARDALWAAKMSGAPAEAIKELEKTLAEEREAFKPNSDARARLRDAMKGELKFNKVAEVEKARDALWAAKMSGAPAEAIEELEKTYAEKREAYRQKGKKVGIRNIEVEGNTITADAKIVSFPLYNEFANPGTSEELLDLSSLTGMAMIVKSADGKLIIQHRAIEKQRLHEEKRTKGNASYTDTPGASVGGLVDASLEGNDREPGTPDSVDTQTIQRQMFKETGEELGLEDRDLKQMRIVGLTQDKVKIHDVALLFAESDLTEQQIGERSRTSKRNKNLGPADFEEKFVTIEASPQAIETLLTQVQCPLPADHAAAFVAAGYTMILQEQGVAAANEWKDRLEQGVRENYRSINKRVADFYDKHPQSLKQVPERFWGKNIPQRRLHEYTPAYGPEEQGLPSFEDEMVRTGLIPETRRPVNKAKFFDVDGVITDPVEKRITEQQIVDDIIADLRNGIPVGLNTGRSITWLKEKVINQLQERIDDPSILKNFVIIGEFGGTWATFDEEGNMHEGKVKNIVIPGTLHDRVKSLINEKYADSMFYDETKETMISIEMKDGHDFADFTTKQTQLNEDLAAILAETGVETTYDVHGDTIATNVRSPYVGKDLGTERFLQFLKDAGINPSEFETFGDSKSDFEMSDELQRRGKKVKMVYVGDRTKLGDLRKEYPTEYMAGFSQGTLAYLQKESGND